MSLVTICLCVVAAPLVAASSIVFCVGLVVLCSLQYQHTDGPHIATSSRGFTPGRLKAQIDGDFVVVLIGSAFNSWHGIPQAISIALSMRQMLNELKDEPDLGFLGATSWLGNPTVSIQYWRSMDHLHKYARSSKRKHVGAWGKFNRYLKQAASGSHSSSCAGIYHEAYHVRAGEHETVYSNMPTTGLGRFTALLPIEDRRSTKMRKHDRVQPLTASQETQAAVAAPSSC